MENIDEINLSLPFVKPFGLISGTSVRGTVGLILVRIVLNCFKFYSIDRFLFYFVFYLVFVSSVTSDLRKCNI